MISLVTIQQIRYRLEAATRRHFLENVVFPASWTDGDKRLVTNAYDDIDELLREVERLQDVEVRLKDVVRRHIKTAL